MIIKRNFDSAREHSCDYCAGEIPSGEDKIVVGMTPKAGPWLWIFHPGCYEIAQVENFWRKSYERNRSRHL